MMNMLVKLLILCIKGYQLCISPFLRSSCRFSPTCSEYMIQSLDKRGFFKGSWMGLKRIGRCHPFSAGGYEPVERCL